MLQCCVCELFDVHKLENRNIRTQPGSDELLVTSSAILRKALLTMWAATAETSLLTDMHSTDWRH